VNYIFEIPGPKSGILKQILGGWQLSGVTAGQSGQPFTIQTGQDTNGNGGGGDRPNVDPNGTFTLQEGGKTFVNNGYYVVPRGTDGLPLRFSLGNGNGERNAHRAAGFWNTDLSLAKRFELGGRNRLFLRIDAFNVFNQNVFGLPITNMSNLSFGQNTNNWGNRSLTASAKISF
jgi:hypothetical protein